MIRRIKEWLRPHDIDHGDTLLRCGCGKLLWRHGEEIKKHQGHRINVAVEGSWWEFLMLKLDKIR